MEVGDIMMCHISYNVFSMKAWVWWAVMLAAFLNVFDSFSVCDNIKVNDILNEE